MKTSRKHQPPVYNRRGVSRKSDGDLMSRHKLIHCWQFYLLYLEKEEMIYLLFFTKSLQYLHGNRNNRTH